MNDTQPSVLRFLNRHRVGLTRLLFTIVILLALFFVAILARADNAKCVGAPPTYEGSTKGCHDARHPRPSKFGEGRRADNDPDPAAVTPQPVQKPLTVTDGGVWVL